jgi:hypothetical protein
MDKTDKALWSRAGRASAFQSKAAFSGGLILRLPIAVIAVIAAIAGLGLFCGDAHAGRRLPTVDNPYCPVTTYTLRDVPEQASSWLDSAGQPVIVVNSWTLRDKPAYGQFLMAHECCHHTLGHVGKYRQEMGHVGPQAFFYIAPELKWMELEADCCAVKLLGERHEMDGIEAARQAMALFGAKPTGAHYPTGLERAENIMECAEADG